MFTIEELESWSSRPFTLRTWQVTDAGVAPHWARQPPARFVAKDATPGGSLNDPVRGARNVVLTADHVVVNGGAHHNGTGYEYQIVAYDRLSGEVAWRRREPQTSFELSRGRYYSDDWYLASNGVICELSWMPASLLRDRIRGRSLTDGSVQWETRAPTLYEVSGLPVSTPTALIGGFAGRDTFGPALNQRTRAGGTFVGESGGRVWTSYAAREFVFPSTPDDLAWDCLTAVDIETGAVGPEFSTVASPNSGLGFAFVDAAGLLRGGNGTDPLGDEYHAAADLYLGAVDATGAGVDEEVLTTGQLSAALGITVSPLTRWPTVIGYARDTDWLVLWEHVDRRLYVLSLAARDLVFSLDVATGYTPFSAVVDAGAELLFVRMEHSSPNRDREYLWVVGSVGLIDRLRWCNDAAKAAFTGPREIAAGGGLLAAWSFSGYEHTGPFLK